MFSIGGCSGGALTVTKEIIGTTLYPNASTSTINIMSVSSAIENFMSWREQHQACMEHDCLENEHNDDAPPPPGTIDVPVGDAEPASKGPLSPSSEARVPPAVETVREADDDEEMGV